MNSPINCNQLEYNQTGKQDESFLQDLMPCTPNIIAEARILN